MISTATADDPSRCPPMFAPNARSKCAWTQQLPILDPIKYSSPDCPLQAPPDPLSLKETYCLHQWHPITLEAEYLWDKTGNEGEWARGGITSDNSGWRGITMIAHLDHRLLGGTWKSWKWYQVVEKGANPPSEWFWHQHFGFTGNNPLGWQNSTGVWLQGLGYGRPCDSWVADRYPAWHVGTICQLHARTRETHHSNYKWPRTDSSIQRRSSQRQVFYTSISSTDWGRPPGRNTGANRVLHQCQLG